MEKNGVAPVYHAIGTLFKFPFSLFNSKEKQYFCATETPIYFRKQQKNNN